MTKTTTRFLCRIFALGLSAALPVLATMVDSDREGHREQKEDGDDNNNGNRRRGNHRRGNRDNRNQDNNNRQRGYRQRGDNNRQNSNLMLDQDEIEFYNDENDSDNNNQNRNQDNNNRQRDYRQRGDEDDNGNSRNKRKRKKISARRVIEDMYETHNTLKLIDGGRAAKALQAYIPPRASRAPISNPSDPKQWQRLESLHDQVIKFVKKPQEPVLVLFGPGGAGKSSYGRYLEEYLWEEYMDDRSSLVPLFIPLTHVYFREERLPLIEEYLTEDFGLEEDELEALRKKKIPFVVILDGYEELSKPVNLYETEDLKKWGARTIITSRAEVLDDPKGVNQFAVQREEAAQLHMGPLSPKNVADYAARFAKSDMNPTNGEWDGKAFLQRLQQLKETVGEYGLPTHHPLALRVLLTLLPQLPRQATGLEIYQSFTDAWLREEARRVRQMLHRRDNNRNKVDDNEVKKMRIKFHNYARDLALTMFEQGVEVVQSRKNLQQTHPVWGRFFTQDTRAEQEGSPVMRVGRYRYRFISNAVQKAFVARHLLDQIRSESDGQENDNDNVVIPEWFRNMNDDNENEEGNNDEGNEGQQQVNQNESDREEKEDSGQESDHEQQEQENIDDDTASLSLLHGSLSRHLLSNEPIIVRFLGEVVAQNQQLKHDLRTLVRLHKGQQQHTVAVANAVMVLNAAGVSFARQDLSGLCLSVRNQEVDEDDDNAWHGACLPGINLTQANLRGSNLRCCRLPNALLQQADVRGALLNGAHLQGAKLSNLVVDMDTECDGVRGYNEFRHLHKLIKCKTRDYIRGSNEQKIETSKLCRRFGDLHVRHDEYDKAVELYDRSWSLLRENLQPGDPDLLQAQQELIDTHLLHGNHAKVISLYGQMLSDRKETLDQDDSEILKLEQKLAEVHLRNGDYTQAKQLYKHVLTVRRRTLNDNHPHVQEAQQGLQRLEQVRTRQHRVLVAAGGSHTCAVTDAGRVKCWGNNNHGQATVPSSLANRGAIALSAGGNNTCALLEGGQVRCWGYNNKKQNDVPKQLNRERFIAVSTGYEHTCGVLNTGRLHCWGSNSHGQGRVPQELRQANFTAVATGHSHTCGILQNGKVKCWGYNSHGQSTVPNDLVNAQFSSIVASKGCQHTCGVLQNGHAKCWGYNDQGQTNAPSNDTFRSLSAGTYHTCGLLQTGKVKCWGYNGHKESTVPNDLANVQFNSVSAGAHHTCGVFQSSKIRCWGNNGSKQTEVPEELR